MKTQILAFALVASVLPLPLLAQEADAGRAKLIAARELYAAGNWETAKEAFGDAYKEAPEDSITRAEAALEWSSLLWEQGYYSDAGTRVKDALAKAKKLKIERALPRLMLTMGHIEASEGKLSDAETTLSVCVKTAKSQRDDAFEALCRVSRRFVRQLRGRSTDSTASYKKHLKTLKRTGDPILVGTSLAKMAELQERSGDIAGAYGLLLDAHAKFEAAGSVPAKSRNRLRLAQSLQNQGKWAEAAKHLDGLEITLKNMHNRPALVSFHALNGKQQSHAGKSKKARSSFDKALSMAKKLKSPQMIANAELAQCEFYANAGERGSAKSHCLEAQRRFTSAGVPPLAARSRILLARLAQREKDWAQAREHYLEALTILEKVKGGAKSGREVAVQRVNLCQVEMQMKATGAHTRCRAALKDLGKLKVNELDFSYTGMVAATRYALGVTAEKRSKAIEHLKRAAELYVEIKDNRQAADAYLRLGRLQFESKKNSDAQKSFEGGLKQAGIPHDLRIELRIQLAQIHLAERRNDKAAKVLKSLIADAATANDKYAQAWAHSAMAQIQLKKGQKEEARKSLKTGLKFAKAAKDADLTASIEANLKKLK